MQLQSDYTTLQKRTKSRSDGSFKGKPLENFCSNYFDLEINPKKSIVYQYDYKLEEGSTVIEKGSQLYYKVVKQLKQDLKDTLGF
jgi:hypothetical protein